MWVRYRVEQTAFRESSHARAHWPVIYYSTRYKTKTLPLLLCTDPYTTLFNLHHNSHGKSIGFALSPTLPQLTSGIENYRVNLTHICKCVYTYIQKGQAWYMGSSRLLCVTSAEEMDEFTWASLCENEIYEDY